MSRLQKKCFVGATSLHCLLLLALVVGPGFFNREKPLDLAVITFEPMILTDDKISGGGSPQAATTPVQQAAPQQQPPQAEPPPPTPAAREQVKPVEPEPQVRETPKTNLPDKDAPVDKAKPKQHQIAVSDKKVKIPRNKTPQTSTARNQSSSAPTANSELASAISNARQRVRSGLSSGTQVNVPDGPGGGGASYANYAQEIQRVYKRAYDQALDAAGDIADGQTVIETSVVIMSSGTVASSSIVAPSGNPALNRLTQRVLDSIRQVPAFPAGAKDSRRTFNIIFDLKPKTNLG